MRKTTEELAVELLPVELQQYMARCVLAGWRIYRSRHACIWFAKTYLGERSGNFAFSLRTLLEIMIDKGLKPD